MATIFTQIVNGTIPSAKVYEDEQTFAFMDINPASRGHTLVICKDEYPDLFSIPLETLTAVALATQRVALALRATLHPDGINILQNNGAASGQQVFHYHVHLIPRWEGDEALPLWRSHPADPAALGELAAMLRDTLANGE